MKIASKVWFAEVNSVNLKFAKKYVAYEILPSNSPCDVTVWTFELQPPEDWAQALLHHLQLTSFQQNPLSTFC